MTWTIYILRFDRAHGIVFDGGYEARVMGEAIGFEDNLHIVSQNSRVESIV